VRIVDGRGEFFDRVTGQKFVGRGNSYLERVEQPDPRGGTSIHQSTFNVGLYSSSRVEAALARMQQSGYNLVTVQLNGLADSEPGPRWRRDYLLNVSDFLVRAKAHGVFVMLTCGAAPYYYDRDLRPPGRVSPTDPKVVDGAAGFNSIYTAEALKSWTASWSDLVRSLRALGAPMDQIFAYELQGELLFDGDRAPFSLNEGSFTTPGQKTYDLSNLDDKARLAGEWAVSWTDAVLASIKAVEPTALVGVGFASPPDPNDKRLSPISAVQKDPERGGSMADFVDFHPYAGVLSLAQHFQKFDLAPAGKKPLLMGEFGAGNGPPSLLAAILQDWQITSCAYGFSGWILWTWDVTLLGDESIDRALRPLDRADPCRPAESARASPRTTIAPVGAARRVKIVSSLPMTGSLRAATTPMANAIRLALDDVGWKIGDTAIDYEALDDASPITHEPDGDQEGRNAARAASDTSVVAYIGPFTSGSAKTSIPILDRAGLVMISPSNTYPGLTRPSTTDPGLLAALYPAGIRNYFRVVSPDDGATGALTARWLTRTTAPADRAYVVYEPPFLDMANGFGAQARELGLTVMGSASVVAWPDAGVGISPALARQIADSGANVLYYAGQDGGFAGQLIHTLAALRPGIAFIGSDSLGMDLFLPGVGDARADVWITTTDTPSGSYVGARTEWLARFRAGYGEPSGYTLETYEAAEVILAAIRAVGPAVSRRAVLANVAATRDYDGLLGRWSFSASGDITPPPVHLYHLEGGRLRYVATGP
jgi:branched-chain amino acid transport system substrate-binding protein